MTLITFFSMVTFALVTSISPGPVNIIALSYGTHYGLKTSLIFVLGATLGYCLQLLLVGLGLHNLLINYPLVAQLIRWGGIIFLLFMASLFIREDGQVKSQASRKNYPFFYGALLQWLNPKAWLCVLAGIGAYTLQGDTKLVWQFTAIYFVVCYLSIACWAYAGLVLQCWLQKPFYMKLFNKLMAVLLIASAVFLAI